MRSIFIRFCYYHSIDHRQILIEQEKQPETIVTTLTQMIDQ